MKILKTANFLKKQAQFNSLPGDPSLPPGVTNQMIEENAGTGENEAIHDEFTSQNPLQVVINDKWYNVICEYEYSRLSDSINVDIKQIANEKGNAIRSKYYEDDSIRNIVKEAIKEYISNN